MWLRPGLTSSEVRKTLAAAARLRAAKRCCDLAALEVRMTLAAAARLRKRRCDLAALLRARRTSSVSASVTMVRSDVCTRTVLPEPVSVTVAEGNATATTVANFADAPDNNTCVTRDDRGHQHPVLSKRDKGWP